MSEAIALYVEIVKYAIPFGVAFSVGQLIVDTFMNMAFGGKIKFN